MSYLCGSKIKGRDYCKNLFAILTAKEWNKSKL